VACVRHVYRGARECLDVWGYTFQCAPVGAWAIEVLCVEDAGCSSKRMFGGGRCCRAGLRLRLLLGTLVWPLTFPPPPPTHTDTHIHPTQPPYTHVFTITHIFSPPPPHPHHTHTHCHPPPPHTHTRTFSPLTHPTMPTLSSAALRCAHSLFCCLGRRCPPVGLSSGLGRVGPASRTRWGAPRTRRTVTMHTGVPTTVAMVTTGPGTTMMAGGSVRSV
jgi:hypothetical protein